MLGFFLVFTVCSGGHKDFHKKGSAKPYIYSRHFAHAQLI